MDTDMESAVLTWLGTTENLQRFDFLRKALDCCPLNENRGLMRLVEHSRKRKLTKRETEAKPGKSSKKLCLDTSTAKTEVPVPSSEVPVPSVPSPWWKSYNDKDIVSIDCEMVSLNVVKNGKHVVEAATVSIVRKSDLKVLYKAVVKHEPGTFIVNFHTKRVNGFTEDSLQDGEELDVIKTEVHKHLGGKLVITVNGFKDISSLDLCMSDYDIFDLHSHWKKWNGQWTKNGEAVMQPIGLRSLYLHYHGKDIHQGVHDATSDAIATCKMFDVYKTVKVTNVTSRMHYPSEDEFSMIQTVAK